MSLESAVSLIESVKDERVLFVGDSIVDEYHYVVPMAKSPKQYLIPVLYQDKEEFEGGVQAAANHARAFCKTVDLKKSASPIRKVRMVEKHDLRKLFEVNYNGISPGDESFEEPYDCVVVTDFGHGWITTEMVKKLCALPYLAVCAQTNSHNMGFNLITKYPRADYVVIDEPEARLAAGDRYGGIESVMQKLSHNRFNKFIVTHGRHGAYGYQDGHFFKMRAFPGHPVDTMGAGDAFFSVTAPMSKSGGIEDLMLIGNAAGSLKCQIPGQGAVTKEKLIEFLKTHEPF